jgi:XTP/dITP diphosphohydrolase
LEKSLLIASGNPGKIREIKEILSPLKRVIVSAKDISLVIKVEETGKTYSENAQLKAAAYLKATGMVVLADDSGIEVDALNGAPGIYSARFSPKENATDSDRRAYLLKKLEGKPRPWSAHFQCSAVLALPGGEFIESSGHCNGIIIPEERGSGGFGYDPIFYIPDYKATMAELPSITKNAISHRAKALSAMIPIIENALTIM